MLPRIMMQNPRQSLYFLILLASACGLTVFQIRQPYLMSSETIILTFGLLAIAIALGITFQDMLQSDGLHGLHISLEFCAFGAAIVLLPPPLPLLIAGAAMLVITIISRYRLHAKFYNICAAILYTGLASQAYFYVTGFSGLHSRGIGTSMLGLGVLVIVLIGVNTILDDLQLRLYTNAPLALHHGLISPHTVVVAIPDLWALSFGIVIAAATQTQPATLILIIPFLLDRRVVLQEIGRAVAAANTLRRRTDQYRLLATSKQSSNLAQKPEESLEQVAINALAIAGAAHVAAYFPRTMDAAILDVVYSDYVDSSTRRKNEFDFPADLSATGEPNLDICFVEIDRERFLQVPLAQHGESPVGMVLLRGVAEPVSDDILEALDLLAINATMALKNQRLHERAVEQAYTDPVTMLYNHKFSQVRLEEEIVRAKRYGENLAVILLDVVEFRSYNRRAWDDGDAVLTAIASVLKSKARTTDIVARFGGDEFLIVLPESEIDDAYNLAERFRELMPMVPGADSSEQSRVHVSIGVAEITAKCSTRELLMTSVISALAASKGLDLPVATPDDGLKWAEQNDVAVIEGKASLATIKAYAQMIDAKDAYTQGHSDRVSRYSVALAQVLGYSDEQVDIIRTAGLLHDVGKAKIPDAILQKDSKLTDEEFAIIKEHPVEGERILLNNESIDKRILPSVRHHHERWDGKGYPDGLGGPDIPFDAAIMAVADAFDAMTSTRSYRKQLSVGEAHRRVMEGKGTQFAPHVVAAFEHTWKNKLFLLEGFSYRTESGQLSETMPESIGSMSA